MTDSDVEWFDQAGGEPVELMSYRSAWAVSAARWLADILQALGPAMVRVEHVGSTAVPGLMAKPVIDLQVAVADVNHEEGYRSGLESLGLVLRAREPERRFFRPPAGSPRTVHVHVCASGSRWESEHLLFRDYLLAHSEMVTAYQDLKVHLAATVGHDRIAYTDGKTEFIRQLLGRARDEAKRQP